MSIVREIIQEHLPVGLNLSEFNRTDEYNKMQGSIKGFHCDKCNNKGNVMILVDGEEMIRPCECMEQRELEQIIHKSGLEESLNRYTFDNFRASQQWQASIRAKALKFVDDKNGGWFFIGGQVGAGKTHICTAIVGTLIKKHKKAKYMMWRDDIVRLKSLRNSDSFDIAIDEYKKVDVLYIDDLFKTQKGGYPSQADIDIAFEIINYRYINQNLITIFSCEKFLTDISDIDEAIGSRIQQRSQGYNISVGYDTERNYRCKEMS